MKESFRWYGHKDVVPLSAIRQAGATAVVSALHDLPNGSVWSQKQIRDHQEQIRSAGLNWDVVESVPIHEDIKLRKGNYQEYIENYKKTLQNLSECGIHTVCYNFMPVLDWTRTHLFKPLADGSTALSFEINALRAFDLFIVKRKNAKNQYSGKEFKEAKEYFSQLNPNQIKELTTSIIAGLPGAEEGYTLEEFNQRIEAYSSFSSRAIQSHLIQFLEAIIPTAEGCGVKMCIHPDDPPFALFGIPRVVSTAEDLKTLFTAVPSLNNGLTFCTGSLGVREDNRLPEIFESFADRIHFLHLRSTQRDGRGNFYEANHLEGDVDMYTIVKSALNEERKRKQSGRGDWEIPMRPDHGHQMLDDLKKTTNPGYSAIGRLKGLAEIRGLAFAIHKTLDKE
ncbi:MAG: mannonate dehydratase [Flavobacteriaceae bacterium]